MHDDDGNGDLAITIALWNRQANNMIYSDMSFWPSFYFTQNDQYLYFYSLSQVQIFKIVSTTMLYLRIFWPDFGHKMTRVQTWAMFTIKKNSLTMFDEDQIKMIMTHIQTWPRYFKVQIVWQSFMKIQSELWPLEDLCVNNI